MAREDFSSASEHFQRALDLNADLPYALVNAAQARSRLGDSPEAERLLRRALELDATDSEAANQLGLVLANRGACKTLAPTSSRRSRTGAITSKPSTT